MQVLESASFFTQLHSQIHFDASWREFDWLRIEFSNLSLNNAIPPWLGRILYGAVTALPLFAEYCRPEMSDLSNGSNYSDDVTNQFWQLPVFLFDLTTEGMSKFGSVEKITWFCSSKKIFPTTSTISKRIKLVSFLTYEPKRSVASKERRYTLEWIQLRFPANWTGLRLAIFTAGCLPNLYSDSPLVDCSKIVSKKLWSFLICFFKKKEIGFQRLLKCSNLHVTSGRAFHIHTAFANRADR